MRRHPRLSGADPGRYGRLLTEGDELLAIREYKDATPEERAVTLCNSGVICAEAAHPLLPRRRGEATTTPRANTT
jgi:bifunctional N-acetylglucosamine-1-phosphate-uridyltransferase/glucosamine-1-phosphate-acetyltransferase GlmU-like protein